MEAIMSTKNPNSPNEAKLLKGSLVVGENNRNILLEKNITMFFLNGDNSNGSQSLMRLTILKK